MTSELFSEALCLRDKIGAVPKTLSHADMNYLFDQPESSTAQEGESDTDVSIEPTS